MLRARHGSWVLIGIGLMFMFTPRASDAAPEAPPSEGAPVPRRTAEPVEAVIEIERAPGAEACPDADAVFSAIRRLFPERSFHQSPTSSERTASARVTIRPLSPGYEARLTVQKPRPGERVILEKEQDCRGLVDALALAFVMLVDPEESNRGTAGTSATTAPAAPASAQTPGTAPPAPQHDGAPVTTRPAEGTGERAHEPPRGHSFHADIQAAAVGGIGVLSEPSLGVAAAVEVFHEGGFGFALQGLRLWATPAEAEGGSVKLTLWGLLLGPCFRGRLSRASSLDGCLLFGAGSQHAQVEHFDEPQSGNHPWTVLSPVLGYRLKLSEMLSGFARIGPVFQLRPQSFSVEFEDGTTAPVAAAPNVGVIAELGLGFGGDFFLMRLGDGR